MGREALDPETGKAASGSHVGFLVSGFSPSASHTWSLPFFSFFFDALQGLQDLSSLTRN